MPPLFMKRMAWELQRNPKIIDRKHEIQSQNATKIDVTAEELIAKLRKLADLDQIDKNDKIRKLSNADIKGAIELLGKHKGLFTDVKISLHNDIPTDPIEYKSWLKRELARLEGTDEVIDSYAVSQPAIAKRY